MYVTRTEAIISAGGAAAYESRTAQLADLLRAQPGFVSGALLNSLGDPARYSFLARWEGREAGRCFARSGALRDFRLAHPAEGLFCLSRPQEAYEGVVDVASEGQGSFVTLVEWNIKPGRENAAAFERSRQELFELRQKYQKGFVANLMRRFLGNPTRYLMVLSYSSREDAWAVSAAPEIQQFLRAHRYHQYAETPPAIEVYDTIRRTQA